jgi:ABC-type branched-subunit amino acid transport system substrate-binding protein
VIYTILFSGQIKVEIGEMKCVDRCVYGAVLLCAIAIIISGCSHDEGEETVPYDPDKAPLKIGVCLPGTGASDEYGKRQWDGIRMAHQLRPAVNDTQISLIVKEPDESMGESGIAGLIENEGLCGAIYLSGVSKDERQAPLARNDDISISVMTARGCMPGNTDMHFLRIGSTLQDQARVAALYTVRSLDAGRTAIVLDQNRSSCVRLASLFSSELIRLGGNIVAIAYVGDKQDTLDSVVTSIMDRHPDSIYIPYSEDSSLEVIALFKKEHSRADIIMTNVLYEQHLLNRGGKSLDKVFMITDFHPDAMGSTWGPALMKKYEENRRELGPLETSAALSADAYLLLVELLEEVGFEDAGLRKESISGIIGVGALDRLTKYMHVSQIKKGIIREARLLYRESINPWDSDLKADIGTE